MNKNKYYCRIDGTIHNLQDIQELIDRKEDGGKIILAMNENHGLEFMDAVLFVDVLEFNNFEIPADYNECLERMKAMNRLSHKESPSIKCPICGSTSVWHVPMLLRILTLFARNKSRVDGGEYECRKCGYTWN